MHSCSSFCYILKFGRNIHITQSYTAITWSHLHTVQNNIYHKLQLACTYHISITSHIMHHILHTHILSITQYFITKSCFTYCTIISRNFTLIYDALPKQASYVIKYYAIIVFHASTIPHATYSN